MGFFKSVMGELSGKTSATNNPMTSGFSAAPQQIQDVFTQLGTGISNTLTNNPNAASLYTPLALQEGEQKAISAINQGFTPTQQSISSDVAMQMNPFDQFVIDAINREGQGTNSVLKQNLAGAGQSGSNRQMLGANDIDLTRLQQIGGFKQNQYNTALQNALGTLTDSRRNDASAQMGAGEFLRGLDLQTKQAPVSALQAAAGLANQGLSPAITTQTQSGTAGSGGSTLQAIGNIAKIGSALGFSDIRLKQDIKDAGTENGHKMYEFAYHWEPEKRYIGVMAQDVLQTHPEAVAVCDGFLCVNYDAIGVKMREVA